MQRKLWEKLVNPAAMKREDYSNMRSVSVGSPVVLGIIIGKNNHITTQPVNKAIFISTHGPAQGVEIGIESQGGVALRY